MKKIFYGWWIVLASFVSLFIGLGVGFYTFGVLFKYLLEEFGWSRTAISGAKSMFSVTSGLIGPVVGRLADQYGSRWIIISGALILGGSFMFLSSMDALWHLYLLYCLIGLGFAATTRVPCAAIISRWFKKRMGTAMGIALVGFGLGGAFISPFSNYLFSTLGWREGCILLGIMVWVFIIPLVALIMKESPEKMGLKPDGIEVPEKVLATTNPSRTAKVEGLKVGEALRKMSFWLIAVAFYLAHAAMVGTTFHLVPFVTDMEASKALAAGILGLTTGISIPSRFGYGFLNDRFDPRYVLISSYAFLAAGTFLCLFMNAGEIVLFYIFSLIFGIGLGGKAVSETIVVAKIFGVASYGSILGLTYIATVLGSASGPLFAGYIFDLFESYHWAFTTFICAHILALGAIFFTKPCRGEGSGVREFKIQN